MASKSGAPSFGDGDVIAPASPTPDELAQAQAAAGTLMSPAPSIAGDPVPVHLAEPEPLNLTNAERIALPGRLHEQDEAGVLVAVRSEPEPEPKKIKLVALLTRPMPEPVRAGLHFWATPENATKWIAAGWAEEWTEEKHGHQHAHNGEPMTDEEVAAHQPAIATEPLHEGP